jgi:hypothetical protein
MLVSHLQHEQHKLCYDAQCMPYLVKEIQVCPGLQQLLHGGVVAPQRSHRERRFTIL